QDTLVDQAVLDIRTPTRVELNPRVVQNPSRELPLAAVDLDCLAAAVRHERVATDGRDRVVEVSGLLQTVSVHERPRIDRRAAGRPNGEQRARVVAGRQLAELLAAG